MNGERSPVARLQCTGEDPRCDTLSPWSIGKTTAGTSGCLKEVPGVFSQGESLVELEENIRDAYDLVRSDVAPAPIPAEAHSKPIEVEV